MLNFSPNSIHLQPLLQPLCQTSHISTVQLASYWPLGGTSVPGLNRRFPVPANPNFPSCSFPVSCYALTFQDEYNFMILTHSKTTYQFN